MGDNPKQPPDLVRLDERMAHVMRSIDEIKDSIGLLATRKEIADMMTRTEHSAITGGIVARLDALELRVKSISPMSLLDVVQRIAVTISALGAAGAVIYQVMTHGGGK